MTVRAQLRVRRLKTDLEAPFTIRSGELEEGGALTWVFDDTVELREVTVAVSLPGGAEIPSELAAQVRARVPGALAVLRDRLLETGEVDRWIERLCTPKTSGEIAETTRDLEVGALVRVRTNAREGVPLDALGLIGAAYLPSMLAKDYGYVREVNALGGSRALPTLRVVFPTRFRDVMAWFRSDELEPLCGATQTTDEDPMSLRGRCVRAPGHTDPHEESGGQAWDNAEAVLRALAPGRRRCEERWGGLRCMRDLGHEVSNADGGHAYEDP